MSIHPDDLPPQNRRRSKRLHVRIPVLVRLQDAKKNSVEEKTHTIIVNSHGALILLAARVNVQQIVRVENVNTKEELLCRVACLGSSFMGKTQVAIEFIMPAPKFWKDRPALRTCPGPPLNLPAPNRYLLYQFCLAATSLINHVRIRLPLFEFLQSLRASLSVIRIPAARVRCSFRGK